MGVRLIRRYPDPVLRRKARRISSIDPSVKKLVNDMLETVHADPGRAGLAAPQVGVSLRVFVICLAGQDDIIMVNPEIVKTKGERIVSESCLSLPGRSGEVKRAVQVLVKGQDLAGKGIRLKAEEFLAQALQHEIDHLNGILYIDRLIETPTPAEGETTAPSETAPSAPPEPPSSPA